MNDILTTTVQWYFGLAHMGFVGVTVQLALVCGVICLFLPNLMMRQERERERRIAATGLIVVERIRKMLPCYEDALTNYVNRIQDRVVDSRSLQGLAAAIPQDVKVKAERDFYAIDANRSERISVLHLQLVSLLNNEYNTQQGV